MKNVYEFKKEMNVVRLLLDFEIGEETKQLISWQMGITHCQNTMDGLL